MDVDEFGHSTAPPFPPVILEIACQLLLFRINAPGGKLVFYAGMSGKPGAVHPGQLIFKNISLVRFWLGNPAWSSLLKVAEHVATAVRLIDEGKLKVPVAAISPSSPPKKPSRMPSAERAGSGCLNRFSASISGASAGIRPPRGAAEG